MRFLEIVFLASLIVSGVALFIPPARRPSFLRYRPALPVTLALVHVFIDHGRWQLFAAYALAGLISLAAIFEVRDGAGVAKDRPILRWLGGLVILGVTGVSAALAWLIPLFSFPAPTGPYKVGTRWLALTDSSRFETLAPSPGGKRQLIVRVWFPADSVAGAADDYIESDVAKGIAAGLRLPSFALSHLANISSHSYRRAWLPAQPQHFPLILFSHGYGVGTESQNTVQMEELASHGFVVASIDHPYEAGAILMPDGKVALANTPLRLDDSTLVRKTLALIGQLQAARDTTAMLAPMRELLALTPALDTSVTRWTDDTKFVLDQITAMSRPHEGSDTLFAGRLATGTVGVFGMSFGGATAAAFCTVDERCAAGINLDGLHYGIGARQPLPRPFVIASSQKNTNVHRLFYERAVAPAWLVTVPRSEHMDYTDFNWFAPQLAARAGMLGGIAPERMHRIMNDAIVPFFDAALRGGKGGDLSALRAAYPELVVESRDGSARLGAVPPAATAADSGAPRAVGEGPQRR